MRKKYSYSYCQFTSTGILRGWAIGITIKDLRKETKQLEKEGFEIVQVPALKMPNKFLESYYWKCSTDTGDKQFLLDYLKN